MDIKPTSAQVYETANLLTISEHFCTFINHTIQGDIPLQEISQDRHCHLHTDALNAGTDIHDGNSVGV